MNPVQLYEFGKKRWYISTITNLSVLNVYNTFFELTFTAPSSAYAIDKYEVYVDGVLNQTCKYGCVLAIKLTELTSYNVSIVAVDIKGHKSLSSNIVSSATTDITYTDADSLAFISASGVSLNYQIETIHIMVTKLKSYSIWSKLKAIYPMIGGTSSSHKFNLKDSRDLDIAYRLQYSGTITHSSNGIKGDGSTGFADTFLNPSTILTLNNTHLSSYVREELSGNYTDIGNQIDTSSFGIISKWSDGKSYIDSYHASNARISFTLLDTKGFFLNNRTSSTVFNVFKNNIKQATNTTTNTSVFVNRSIYLCAVNTSNRAFLNWSPKTFSFFTIGDGLSDAEASNLYTIIQLFQTTLGRQV